MPAPKVVRLPPDFIDSQAYIDLEAYLSEQWSRAELSRQQQVDNKYTKWQKLYEGTPAQAMRTLPWPNSSNYVVQMARMFIDTYVARTLNVVFATRPLYTLDFLPRECRESTERYLNKKALCEWQHYNIVRGLLQRGPKNGTAIAKTTYVVENEIDVTFTDGVSGHDETEVTTYDGPKTTIVPFEDFYIYPITCNNLEDAEIKFHKIRYIEEYAVRQAFEHGWPMTEQEIRSACQMPKDVKRDQEQAQAGVTDQYLRELHLVECHFKYDLNRNGKMYQIIALLEPTTRKFFDIYYNPYPRNLRIFQDYRPAPKEDFFYGDSWCEILSGTQEEASQIHNDRRNTSYIINAPVFKRKSGSLIPNPSSNWYPGKVFDLDSMDDFEMVNLGGDYNDMLGEENHNFQLAERLVGLGAVMQGNASGMMGKRGIYNAAGTLAVLSESNQRQDTNIRDVREVIGAIAKQSFILQRTFNPTDPLIDSEPPEIAAQIREGMRLATPEIMGSNYFQIKASDAGANSETAKANTMQITSVIGQYGAAVLQLSQQYMSIQNPQLQAIMMETIKMHKWMATRVLRVFGEYDGESFLPDAQSILGPMASGGTPQNAAANPQQVQPNRNGVPSGPELQQLMAQLSQMPTPNA